MPCKVPAMSAKASSYIDRLPAELKLEIVRDKGLSTSDKQNLCLVKPFAAVPTEKLYETIRIRPQNWTLVLRTLVRNPTLRTFVRDLTIWDEGGYDESRAGTVHVEEFKNAVDLLPLPGMVKEWMAESIAKAHISTLLTVLVMLIPGLRQLSCEGGEPLGTACWLLPLQQTVDPYFQALQSINISLENTNFSQCLPIFKLPVLETLVISYAHASRGNCLMDTWSKTLLGSSSTISKLSFYWCSMELDLIALIIRICPQLRSLTILNSYRFPKDTSEDFSIVAKALAELTPLLDCLTIYSSIRNAKMTSVQSIQPLGTGLTRTPITHLRVSPAYLFGSSNVMASGQQLSRLLPEDLHRFTLKAPTDEFLNHMFGKEGMIEFFLQELRGGHCVFTQLSSVRVWGDYDRAYDETESRRNELCDGLAEFGIRLDVDMPWRRLPWNAPSKLRSIDF